jgi:hypothetical protein
MTTEDDTKELMNNAESAFTREYRAEIQAQAEDIRRRITADEFADACDVYQAVEEALDGHQYVIYTNYNPWVLLVTDHGDAMAEELGIEASHKTNWAQLLSQITYFAMKADVMEELGDVESLMTDDDEEEDEEAETEEMQT